MAPSESSGPVATPTSRPSGPPPSASAAIPIHGSAREISPQEAGLAPGPDGGLYVSISVRTGPAVLLLLDRDGRPRPGWPIAIEHSTQCGVPLPVSDGSVRIVCDATDLPQPDLEYPAERAMAFDADGRLMGGWPVTLSGPTAYGMGPDLTIVAERSLSNDETGEVVSHDATMTTIAADGAVQIGTKVAFDTDRFGGLWGVAPDGVAYDAGPADGDTEVGALTALDRSGVRSGWPVKVHGFASAPGFGPEGQIAITLGSADRHTTHVSVFDRAGTASSSGVLPMATAERTMDTGGCSVNSPQAPLLARNGDIFVYSELDGSIYGLTPSLAIMKGWPIEPSAALATARPGLEFEHEAGYCPTPVVPGVGPDGTLVMALEARNSKVGGSLVAVGANARVRAGWPVELKRAGSEFWSVVVGTDGTVYALAVEPEAGGKSSASVLAIAPDSTVRWTTTIIDP